MQSIRIIGSTELGWHPVHLLTLEVLINFAEYDDVHFFDVTVGGVKDAPATCYGYAACSECPFTLDDAHAVLRLSRPVLMEAKSAKHKIHNRVK